MAKQRRSLSDQLRRAVRYSGHSQYQIAKEAGIDKAALSRFMAGQRGLTTPSLDRLTEYLGMQLCPAPPDEVWRGLERKTPSLERKTARTGAAPREGQHD
jgi:transcriptional regulator with XRE-family HTH domain